MDMIGGAEILRRRIEQRRKLMAEETDAKTLEVFQEGSGEWAWHAQGGNNEIVADGRGFNTRENAIRAAEDAFPGVPLSVETTINEGGEDGAATEGGITAKPSEVESLPTEAELADEMAAEEEDGQTRADEEADEA